MVLDKLKLIFEQAVSLMQNLEDSEALKNKIIYLDFSKLIGKTLPLGYKFTFEGKLYKTLQDNLVIQEQYKPSINTASLYVEINEVNQGTLEDPIPYNNNMELKSGLYYIQSDVIYKCIRDTGAPVYHDLSDLVGLYVEKVEN